MTEIERKLISSEDNIKRSFNGIPIPIYVWQKVENDLIFVDYNSATEKITKNRSAFLRYKL